MNFINNNTDLYTQQMHQWPTHQSRYIRIHNQLEYVQEVNHTRDHDQNGNHTHTARYASVVGAKDCAQTDVGKEDRVCRRDGAQWDQLVRNVAVDEQDKYHDIHGKQECSEDGDALSGGCILQMLSVLR